MMFSIPFLSRHIYNVTNHPFFYDSVVPALHFQCRTFVEYLTFYIRMVENLMIGGSFLQVEGV